jgi:hypothetical protein
VLSVPSSAARYSQIITYTPPQVLENRKTEKKICEDEREQTPSEEHLETQFEAFFPIGSWRSEVRKSFTFFSSRQNRDK